MGEERGGDVGIGADLLSKHSLLQGNGLSIVIFHDLSRSFVYRLRLFYVLNGHICLRHICVYGLYMWDYMG
jgi:hypothetical protein